MAVIYINNKPYEAHEGKNLLETCLSLGFDIPYFCWHPALGSVGACRQCAVKKFRDENDTAGRIVMSCMEPVADGLRIATDDPDVLQFRAGVIELLMTNHPHDCPVCDEGGECHLQDMTVMTGHDYRRFRFKKRTYANQYLGPFINHEMNRCIQCYRCVRFYRDYAGGRDFEVFSAHDHVYFGRHEHGALGSEFSGNLVEVCPTGVFTDKTLKKHYTRKWDLQSAPSVCVHCGLGCNIIAGERYGTLRRVLSRYNGSVNGYFICDRGRYGYEFVNSEKRVVRARMRNARSGAMEQVTPHHALSRIGEIMSKGKVIGIGSPRASVESNFALLKLVGGENFYSGMSAAEHDIVTSVVRIMKSGCARFPSLKETEKADAVLVLGEDVTNTAPMLALSLRQSIKNRAALFLKKNRIPQWDSKPLCLIAEEETGPLCISAPMPTKLDDSASQVYRASPAGIARLGFAVAHAIKGDLPPVPGLSEEEEETLAKNIALELSGASNPLVVSGASCLSVQVVEAAANIAGALTAAGRHAGLFFTLPECNSAGLTMLADKTLAEAFARADQGPVAAAVILENDLYRRADKRAVDRFLERCGTVILLDSLETAMYGKAGIVLPAAPFAGAEGTLVNNECRAQRFYRAMKPEEDAMSSWRWLRDIREAVETGSARQWEKLDDIIAAVVDEFPDLGEIKNAAPSADLRIAEQRFPRQPHRYSGRTSMKSNVSIHEQKPAEDLDSPLSFSMEGYRGAPPSPLIPFFWAPRWNSVQSINKFQSEIGGPLNGGDPGRRIVTPSAAMFEYFSYRPETGMTGAEDFLIIPYSRIFGSEELSAFSSSIAEMIPPGALLMNNEDANRMGIVEDHAAHIDVSGIRISMPVKIEPAIPAGLACYPIGQPGIEFISLPARGKISGAV